MQSEFLKIYCDGGARGNPGPAASAFAVIDSDGEILHRDAQTLGVATNNIAEYTAVLIALDWLNKNARGVARVDFFLDSLLVVNQLNGLFKIKNKNLAKIAQEIKDEISRFPGVVSFQHVRREKNTLADSLVNKALDALPISE